MSRQSPDATLSVLEEMVREGEVPGIQYVAVTKDRTLVQAALGVRDAATGEPMERATLQMAYSTTKAVTAVAAMLLVEAGKLDLDRPLDAYYRAHPYGGAVTIRSLLAQTSGVPNAMPLDWFAVEGEPLDREAMLRRALARSPRLSHAPGTEYGYSNLSYWLLEKAIEAASGLDFARYVAEHVFAPLAVPPGEAGFSPGPAGDTATGHARRYSPTSLVLSWLTPSEYWLKSSGRWRRVAPIVPHGLGYGGLFASASALAAILQDLLRERPILCRPETRAAMFTPQRTSRGEPIAMTLGWVTGEVRGARYFGKQGGGLGFHGNVRVYPEEGVATVMLANATEVAAGPIDARSDAVDAGLLVTRRRTPSATRLGATFGRAESPRPTSRG
jgi:D-alanyl-D-alanine carboxypeptidase